MIILTQYCILFLQIFILCLFLALSGFLIKKIIFNSNDIENFEENCLFGFLSIGFVALFINFFYPLSLFLNNICFLLLIYYAFKLDFFNQNNFRATFKKLDKKKPLYIYCRSGNRSSRAAKQLAGLGFEKIYDLKGGYMKWRNQ